MTNKHVRDLRMLASLNGVQNDDQLILLRAASAIEKMRAELAVIVAVEGIDTWAGNKAQKILEETTQ